jgi:putative hydrolase of the HAD superfamily
MNMFGKARKVLHGARAEDPLSGGDFYTAQAYLMARERNPDAGEDETAAMRLTVERLIYRGWEPIFKKVRLFSGVVDTLSAIRRAGLKLGLLSDFPPERKLEYLGLGGLWDAALCSEVVGRLKPDPAPFFALAAALGTPPERVLYVGNSRRYDVAGAAGAGMKTALKVPFTLFNAPFLEKSGGNFVFPDYRHLYDYVVSSNQSEKTERSAQNERGRWQ